MTTDRRVLRCRYCGLPFAALQNGVLIIESKHNSTKHVNVLTLEVLQQLMREPSPSEYKAKIELK
jgi:hypothetical protein